MSSVVEQSARRRTFAIISHPDAGKTTITEKFLLYANAISLAGSVKARKASRHAISDWMQMEQERGISITSSVLQFEHRGSAINLVDTPGHADFSADTYRTLAAVDSALMVMDHSKGVEPRTRKLFEVCRLRQLPVVTFMNKLDRHGLEPLALVDDVAQTLDLRIAPINWPVGMGRDFRGVVEIASSTLLLYETGAHHGQEQVASSQIPWAAAEARVGAELYARVSEEIELLAAAGDSWDEAAYMRGELSPLFWGSAMTNFGVDPLLTFVADNMAPPAPRAPEEGPPIRPGDEQFTGMVFKIQANMNPRHRDRVAFVRVVSGRFDRGMEVRIGRSGAKIRLSNPHSFMAQDRALVEGAWPGDIIGIHDSGKLRVGDTLAAGEPVRYTGIPQFAPEHFGQMRLKDPLKRKSLDAGVEQLSQEGVVQVFYRGLKQRQDPYLGVVGLLQFEVLKQRLKNEYNVNAELVSLPFKHARWVGGTAAGVAWLQDRSDYVQVVDRFNRTVVLAEREWSFNYALEHASGLELYDIEPLD
jgi:peptide chain release factor 3